MLATDRAARIALLYVAWHAAHGYADHWGQDNRDALDKGEPGRTGRAACARHVLNLTATKLAALAIVGAAAGIRLSPRRVAVAMALDAASHYVIDRRTPLRRLAHALGKDEFIAVGDPAAAPCGTAAYELDQSLHTTLLALAAVIAGG